MDNFVHLLYRQRGKNLDYVEDANNCAGHKELTVLKNGGSTLFYQRWRLTFLPLNVHVNDNSLAKILSLKYVKNIPRMRVTIDT